MYAFEARADKTKFYILPIISNFGKTGNNGTPTRMNCVCKNFAKNLHACENIFMFSSTIGSVALTCMIFQASNSGQLIPMFIFNIGGIVL